MARQRRTCGKRMEFSSKCNIWLAWVSLFSNVALKHFTELHGLFCEAVIISWYFLSWYYVSPDVIDHSLCWRPMIMKVSKEQTKMPRLTKTLPLVSSSIRRKRVLCFVHVRLRPNKRTKTYNKLLTPLCYFHVSIIFIFVALGILLMIKITIRGLEVKFARVMSTCFK